MPALVLQHQQSARESDPDARRRNQSDSGHIRLEKSSLKILHRGEIPLRPVRHAQRAAGDQRSGGDFGLAVLEMQQCRRYGGEGFNLNSMGERSTSIN